ncbi:unnamed protein product [Effrenium voratum]|nr:unnamed protein product [Effrenium voratum]
MASQGFLPARRPLKQLRQRGRVRPRKANGIEEARGFGMRPGGLASSSSATPRSQSFCPERPLTPLSVSSSGFFCDAAESFSTRLAAAVARSLVERYGSLARAFNTLAPQGAFSRTEWMAELEPIQEQLEENGQPLQIIFTKVLGAASLDTVSYENWCCFFQCLRGSHAEDLLDKELGPRHGGPSVRSRRLLAPRGDLGEDPTGLAPAAPAAEPTKSEVPTPSPARSPPAPSPGGFSRPMLKMLMSRHQVEEELSKRYSSTGVVRLPYLPPEARRLSLEGAREPRKVLPSAFTSSLLE